MILSVQDHFFFLVMCFKFNGIQTDEWLMKTFKIIPFFIDIIFTVWLVHRFYFSHSQYLLKSKLLLDLRFEIIKIDQYHKWSLCWSSYLPLLRADKELITSDELTAVCAFIAARSGIFFSLNSLFDRRMPNCWSVLMHFPWRFFFVTPQAQKTTRTRSMCGNA